ncbi:MAG: DUF1730 domain-containing protein [Myxococcota bacterium]|nr:DUF1730 domain-containing protein [Myxococcota bacterium]
MKVHPSDLVSVSEGVLCAGVGLEHGALSGIASLLAREGAVAAGVVRAGPLPEWITKRYEAWLCSGNAKGLDYLGRHHGPRFDTSHVGLLQKGASLVLCAAFPYADGARQDGLWPLVARHARGVDYHLTVRDRLARVSLAIEQLVPGSRCRVVVDTAPLLERSLAVACGLGTIGRSGMLLVPSVGPKVVLGEIICAEVPADGAAQWPESRSEDFPDCGDCRACVDACPLRAIQKDGTVDVRRCLSYWTIEAPDQELPIEVMKTSQLLFGCDVCTEVCPKCRPMATALEPGPSGGLDALSLVQLEDVSNEELSKALRGTALERTGISRVRRNARAVAHQLPRTRL